MKRLVAALVVLGALFSVGIVPAHAQSGTTYYVVQPGDNLFRIGLKFNIRADVLAQINGIVNPNLVYVGQKLIIPAGATIPTSAPAANPAALVSTQSASDTTGAVAVETAAASSEIATPADVTGDTPTSVP